MDPSFTASSSASKFQLSAMTEWPIPCLTPPSFPDFSGLLEYFPSSSSFDCSLVNLPNISLHNSNTSSPDTTYISCDAPLVAPTPMPYHVPEFIDFDFVPLDHVSHRLKRKRVDDYECHQRISQKRSALLAPWPGVEPILSKNHSSTRIKTSRIRARRSGRNRPSQSSRFQIPPKSMYT